VGDGGREGGRRVILRRREGGVSSVCVWTRNEKGPRHRRRGTDLFDKMWFGFLILFYVVLVGVICAYGWAG
jgi:hypothetical protein